SCPTYEMTFSPAHVSVEVPQHLRRASLEPPVQSGQCGDRKIRIDGGTLKDRGAPCTGHVALDRTQHSKHGMQAVQPCGVLSIRHVRLCWQVAASEPTKRSHAHERTHAAFRIVMRQHALDECRKGWTTTAHRQCSRLPTRAKVRGIRMPQCQDMRNI